MKLSQVRFLCAIVDRDLNISAAAAALHTSQPGVSRHMQSLEQEVGTKLFVRRNRRIVGLTKAGQALLVVARRIVADIESAKKIANEFSSRDSGNLVIATTPTHARYALPRTILKFIKRYPKVRLSLRQGNPTEIAEWVEAGTVDLSIAAAPLIPAPDLVLLPCYDLQRILLTRPEHPLQRLKKPLLSEIAQYPMITYDALFTGRTKIAEDFKRFGLNPHIVLSATDADVMKAYVKLGLGIAILGSIAFDPAQDKDLRSIDVRYLFKPNPIYVGLRKDTYLRTYALDFIEMFAPKLTRAKIERAMAASNPRRAV